MKISGFENSIPRSLIKKLSPALKISLFSFLIALTAVLYFIGSAFIASKKIYTLNNINSFYYSNDYDFSFSISKKWTEQGKLSVGAQYDCVFTNHTIDTLYNWTCHLVLPEDCFIDSSWSGVFNQFNGNVYIYPVHYNESVQKDKPVSFGFILHSREVIENPQFHIVFTKSMNPFHNHYFKVIFALMVVLAGILVFVIISDIRFVHLHTLLNQTFDTVVNIVDSFDEYTYHHSRNVAFYSMELARRMKLKHKDVMNIYYVGLVHDIGKISIMRDMLNKQGKFSEEERESIKKHTIAGGEALKDFTSIPQIKDGALYHHERFDGTGYPEGLAGKNIPLFARIICVADCFDVMTSKRCYQDKFQTSEVIEELKNCSGTQFDPKIVPYMIEMINEGIAPIKYKKS